MKVQIITLDPQDDRASVADKLSWAQAPRVLLVWPRYGRPLPRRLDLVLLQRQARRRHIELGLVTADPEVRERAASLGLAVFDSAEQPSEDAWRASRPAADRPARRQPRPVSLARAERGAPAVGPAPRVVRMIGRGFLAIAVLLSLIGVAAASIPRAEIVLSPKATPYETVMTLILDPTSAAPSADGRIPARRMTLRISGETRVPTTGTTSVPTAAASGEVLLGNVTDEDILIPAGAVLRTAGPDPVRFVTVDEVTLPAGVSLLVEVQASEPGPRGNAGADEITVIEGPLGLQATATNPEPMHGGASERRAAVSAADRREALASLTQQLLQEAAQQIQSAIPPGSVLAINTLEVVEESERHFDHAVGEAADTLALSLEIEAGALVYARSDAEVPLRLALAAERPGGVEVPGTFEAAVLSEATTGASGVATMRVEGRWETVSSIDTAALASLVTGLSPAEALRHLEQRLDLASPPQIRLSPSWLPRLPWLTHQIDVRYAWETG